MQVALSGTQIAIINVNIMEWQRLEYFIDDSAQSVLIKTDWH